MSDRLCIDMEADRIHPKHRILRYKEWFLDKISGQDVVLDIGSNTGVMVEFLASKAAFVYGIEIVPGHYQEACKIRQKPNIQYLLGDATVYDYQSLKSVNVVTLSNVLEHINNRVEFLCKIRHGVVWKDRSHKRFLIRVPMIDRDWMVLLKKEHGLEWRLDDTHCTEYTAESFREEMLQAGLSVDSMDIRFGEIYAVCRAQ